MKNLFKKAANKIKSIFVRLKAALATARLRLADNRGEGFVDSGVFCVED